MKKHHAYLGLTAAALMLCSCQAQRQSADGSAAAASQEISISNESAAEDNSQVLPLNLDTPVLPSMPGISVDGSAEELAPINLTIGVINSVVLDLQQRLMDLGFMEPDEPTNYYGPGTSTAVQYFQRQIGLPADGICGVNTWDAIMAADAPHYSVGLGTTGDDITRIQQRLYDLGYLANASQVTGTFSEDTKAAVEKLQNVNGLAVDGKVGTQTNTLLYSDTIKANFLALGEKSELVKKYQERLIQLGYMAGEADGSYGQGTVSAVQKFQSRNDQVVDGYLGPGTRAALDSANAKPFAIRLGDTSDEVKEIQKLLVKYNYLSSGNDSGYFGELTQNAVTRFQTLNKLTADGTVGMMTYAKLTDGSARKNSSSSGSKSSSGAGKSSGSKNSSGKSSGGSSSAGKSSGAGSGVGSGGATVSGSAGALISIASSKIGSPYVWGAKGSNSFDCSGFVYYCLNQAGVNVSYMTSYGWRNPGRFQRVSSFSQLQAGDIVVVPGHVGIAAGDGTVIDASSSNGRVVHRSLSGWWQRNFIVGWRIFG